MIKKYFLFLLFQLKAVSKTLPRLALCTVVLSAIVFVAGYCGNLTLNEKETLVSVSVAIVMPDDDDRLELGYNFLENLDSFNEVCTFREMEIEDAKRALKNNEISVIIEIPEGFVDGIIYGDNVPATLITHEDAGFETLLFCAIVSSGVSTISYTQAGIYSVGDLLREYGQSSHVAKAEENLNIFYLKYALNRGYFFDNQSTSATGEVSTIGYYIASGIILLTLLCGLTVNRYFSCHPESVLYALKRCGIRNPYIRFTELFSISALFYVLFGTIILIVGLTIGKKEFELSFLGMLMLFAIILSIVSFLMFINSLARNKLASTLLTFLLTALMLYMCGRIIPVAFLPEGVVSIGRILPAYYWGKSLEGSLFGGLTPMAVFAPMLIAALFYGATLASDKIQGRER